VHVTARDSEASSRADELSTSGPGATSAYTEVSSLSRRGQEASKSANAVMWTVPTTVAPKNELVSCIITDPVGDSNFSFFQRTSLTTDWDQYILLYNQSTCHIFRNKSLLMNIQPADSPIVIHSTARVTYADTIGYIRNFPDPIYICEEGIANILSFAKVREAGCIINYDSSVDTFVVQGPGKTITFNCLPSGLYRHRVPSTGVCLVVTVDSPDEGYSPRQIASAKNARKAMSMMGSPSAATFKLI